MKFCRIGQKGQEIPAVLDDTGVPRSLVGIIADIDSLSVQNLKTLLEDVDIASLPLANGERYGPCVAPTSRVICIGLNYSDHAAESGLPIPKEPIVFMKSCLLTGPNDDVAIPPEAKKVDWEAELAVVIARRTYRISEAEVPNSIAGYCIMNDLSERAFQHERGGQWIKGKSLPGFAPLGPWLVTPDEVDPDKLDVWLDVDSERYQDGNTSELIFRIPTIISYLSHFMELQPGDIISTGTPAGVGAGLTPPRYLQPGETVRLGISNLGTQEQRFIQG
jgi:2-keto-4-pentenoate hydratase/2-oxohepta-3-ene-1,7-dioic acid hydratase in catechol pathway